VQVSILGIRSAIEDRAALEDLLSLLPSPGEIRQFLASMRPGNPADSRMFFYAATGTASFITIWRTRVVCLFALNVKAYQASSIERQLNILGSTSWMSLPMFQDAVEFVIDASVNPGLPKGHYQSEWWQPPRRFISMAQALKPRATVPPESAGRRKRL